MNLLTKTCLTAAVLCAFGSPAMADTQDIRAADKAVEFDVGGDYLKYGESVNRTTFDTETGWIPSMKLGLTWLRPEDDTYVSNLYLHVDGQASFGDAHYNGGVQVDNSGTITDYPFQTNTNEQVYHVTGKVGRFFELTNGLSATPYLDVGLRGWQRSIQGGTFNMGGTPAQVGSETETYQHFEGGGGLLLQASPMPRLVLSGTAQVGSTFGATMRTGGLTYNLGSRPVWQFGGSAGYAVTPRFELITSAQLDGFGYNKSAVLHVGGSSYEPDSFTHQLTVMGGIAYHLQ